MYVWTVPAGNKDATGSARSILPREKREKSKEDMLRQKAEDKAVRDVLYSDVPDAGKKEIRLRIARLSRKK